MAGSDKVRNIRRWKMELSFTSVIFILIFLYGAYHLLRFSTAEKYVLYEVGDQVSLTADSTYTGLILRDEHIVSAEGNGYVNFYVPEGKRISVGNTVYSIDENGQFSSALSTASGETGLSEENLQTALRLLRSFAADYDDSNFEEVYSFRQELSNRLLNMISTADSRQLQAMGINTDFFHTYDAQNTGIVEYYFDGYEARQDYGVYMADFDRKQYQKSVILNRTVVEKGTPVYKYIDSETWHIILLLDEAEYERFSGAERLKVRFPENGLETTVLSQVYRGPNGEWLMKLSLSRYMVQFADQRYLQVEILSGQPESGLKIPLSAVTDQSFLTVPAAYLTKGGASGAEGFYSLTTGSDGTEKAVFITPEIIFVTEDKVYVTPESVPAGTVLVMPDSQETHIVSEYETLSGVYCMNKGYAVFKSVDIVDRDESYCIVRKGLAYSIAAYDHILLDGNKGSTELKLY